MTTIAAIADLHGFLPDTPPCDILIVAGDVTPVWDHRIEAQREWCLGPLSEWIAAQPATHVVGVAGNHDFVFVEDPALGDKLGWHYLEGDAVDLEGLTIWGSPLASWFRDWAFMRHENELAEEWKRIPAKVDVIVTHGPAYGARDTAQRGVSTGSPSLRERIMQLRPALHVCGHIHEAYGVDAIRYAPHPRAFTLVGNASCVDIGYRNVNRPLVFEIGGDGDARWRNDR